MFELSFKMWKWGISIWKRFKLFWICLAHNIFPYKFCLFPQTPSFIPFSGCLRQHTLWTVSHRDCEVMGTNFSPHHPLFGLSPLTFGGVIPQRSEIKPCLTNKGLQRVLSHTHKKIRGQCTALDTLVWPVDSQDNWGKVPFFFARWFPTFLSLLSDYKEFTFVKLTVKFSEEGKGNSNHLRNNAAY